MQSWINERSRLKRNQDALCQRYSFSLTGRSGKFRSAAVTCVSSRRNMRRRCSFDELRMAEVWFRICQWDASNGTFPICHALGTWNENWDENWDGLRQIPVTLNRKKRVHMMDGWMEVVILLSDISAARNCFGPSSVLYLLFLLNRLGTAGLWLKEKLEPRIQLAHGALVLWHNAAEWCHWNRHPDLHLFLTDFLLLMAARGQLH